MTWNRATSFAFVGALALAGCGEKHSYAGTIKGGSQSDAAPSEATFTKTGDDEATLTFKGKGVIELERCSYPIKLKRVDGIWNPDGCSFKYEAGGPPVELTTTLVGNVEISGGAMKMSVTMVGVPSGERHFEFEGKER